jgi:hypothetical protein
VEITLQIQEIINKKEVNNMNNMEFKPKMITNHQTSAQRELRSKSLNNIYPELQDDDVKPIKRYMKTTVGMVSFSRRDPTIAQRVEVDGLLRTARDKRDDLIWDYNHEVIELYSEADVRFFERQNAALIADGKIVDFIEADLVWAIANHDDAMETFDNGPYHKISDQVMPKAHHNQGHAHYMLSSRQVSDDSAFDFTIDME